MWQPLDVLVLITGAQLREGGASPPAGRMVQPDELPDDKVVQGLPTKDAHLLNEVRVAYGDYDHGFIPTEVRGKQHCRAFLNSDWFIDGKALARAFAILGTYDNFDANKVAEATTAINENCGDTSVAVGREGHPVIYIQTDSTNMARDIIMQKADSAAILERSSIKAEHAEALDDSLDTHRPCEHEEPPVRENRVAVTKDASSVVRAEWYY